MANIKFNVGRGKFREYHDRIANNDPATAGFILVATKNTGVEATVDARLVDLDNLSLVLADGDVDEFDGTGYARIELTDADIAVSVPDDGNDRVDLDFADPQWLAIDADGVITDITDIILCYAPDVAGLDTTLIPLGSYDFVVTPNGGTVNIVLNAQGYATV